ncbi:MAG: hypothetical protein ACC662_10030, partial [Planctomycetota bacterium]
VDAVRYFGLVRAFLDGVVAVKAVAGEPDPADWADLPFVPRGLERQDVFRAFTGRVPYVLQVRADRHRLEREADAVVRAARAEVVLGRDGQARVRVTWRLFNRRRQFLRVRLPRGAVLYGATPAGRPIKPLEGPEGSLLLPIPKVPLGGVGFAVAVLYRAPAGGRLPGSALEVTLPEVLDTEVDRTVVRVHAPREFDYDVETEMTPSAAADVAADLAGATLREARGLLEVAADGTLEQRRRATGNGLRLLREARALGERAGRKQAGLQGEIEAVARHFAARSKALDATLRARSRAIGFQGVVPQSNAALILTVQGHGAQTRAEAAWRFNDAEVAPGGKKKDVKVLKERLGKAIERRGRLEQEQQGVQRAQAAEGKGAPPTPSWEAQARNILLLNEVLDQEQRKNAQLEAGGRAITGSGGVETPSGNAGFFRDGADGDVRGRLENVYEQAIATRRGLMGLDVPLPRTGKVFLFRSAKTGAPIVLRASTPGLGLGWRWVIFLLVTAALVLGVGGLARLRARRLARRLIPTPPAGGSGRSSTWARSGSAR